MDFARRLSLAHVRSSMLLSESVTVSLTEWTCDCYVSVAGPEYAPSVPERAERRAIDALSRRQAAAFVGCSVQIHHVWSVQVV